MAKQQKKNKLQKKSRLSNVIDYVFRILETVIVSAIVVFAGLRIYNAKYAEHLISVDFNKYVQKQEALFLTKKITKAQFEKRLDDASNIILSYPKNDILVDSKAFLKVKKRIKLEDILGKTN